MIETSSVTLSIYVFYTVLEIMIRYLRLMQTTSSEVMEHTPLCEESWWKGQGMYSCRAVKHLRSINNHHEISSPCWVVVGIAIYQQGKKIPSTTILWCIIHSTTLLKSCKDLIMSHTILVLVLSLFFLFLPHTTVHFIYVFCWFLISEIIWVIAYSYSFNSCKKIALHSA